MKLVIAIEKNWMKVEHVLLGKNLQIKLALTCEG